MIQEPPHPRSKGQASCTHQSPIPSWEHRTPGLGCSPTPSRCGLGLEPVLPGLGLFFSLQVLFYQRFKKKNKLNPKRSTRPTSCVNPCSPSEGAGAGTRQALFAILVPIVGQIIQGDSREATKLSRSLPGLIPKSQCVPGHGKCLHGLIQRSTKPAPRLCEANIDRQWEGRAQRPRACPALSPSPAHSLHFPRAALQGFLKFGSRSPSLFSPYNQRLSR